MAEILYKLDALSSPEDPRDFQAESIFPSGLSLPSTYDPRKSLLPIRNQGAAGSCVGEASATMREIQESKSEIKFEDYFSPQFIYNNRCNQPAEGMYPRDSMKILYKKGVCAEEDYPYGKIETPDRISQDIYSKALNYKVQGYAYVNTIEILKAAIYRNGACVITVPVYHMGANMWKPMKQGELSNGAHAMAVVGWNSDGFIIRNSWGSSWNNGGYTIFPYSDWGMQGEVWTVIDDSSSKPDPKYSKWYWKTWRAIKNTFVNIGVGSFMIVLVFVGTIYMGLTDAPWAFVGSALIPIVLTVISAWKKLYLIKDKDN